MRRHSPPIPRDTVVVGVDIAKRAFVAVRLSGDGRWSRPKRYDNTGPGVAGLYEDVHGSCDTFVVAFEPTGHHIGSTSCFPSCWGTCTS